MFDSIKIGLDYLKDKCEKIFVSPVEVPLFTADTVEALLFCKTAVGIPTYKGRTGHPVILGNDAVFKILMYSGNGGLRKVITELSLEIDYIETKDKGILCDIDTKEDYTGILKLYSEQYGKDKE
jgi:CTP:molybdopterin cytidylyltransferase MocA